MHVVTVELDYADACYPPVDPAVIAYLLARLSAASRLSAEAAQIRPWLRLSWLMAMIDDFGGVSIDDVLHRVDGSAVLDELGTVRRRSWLPRRCSPPWSPSRTVGSVEVRCSNVVYKVSARNSRDFPLRVKV